MLDNKTILLKLKSPACKFGREIFFRVESWECCIVSNDNERMPLDVGLKLLEYPDESKAFELQLMVSHFGFTELPACIGNNTFFSLHILLQQRCPQANLASIGMDNLSGIIVEINEC